MLEYIDPRTIDWTSSPNPLATAGYRRHLHQAIHEQLNHPVHRAMQESVNYRLRLVCVPDGPNYRVAGGATFEDRVFVSPGSFLLAFSATSQQAAGYKVQVKDLTSGTLLYTQSTSFQNVTAGAPSDQVNPVSYLPKPRAIPSGFLSIRVQNLAGVTNTIQVVAWIAEPLHDLDPEITSASGTKLQGLQAAPPQTGPDAILYADMLGAQLARRITQGEGMGIFSPITPPSAAEVDLSFVPIIAGLVGDNVLIAPSGGAIGIHEMVIWNTATQTVTFMDGTTGTGFTLLKLKAFPGNNGYTLGMADKPHFIVSAGNPFVVNLSAGAELNGFVRFKAL